MYRKIVLIFISVFLIRFGVITQVLLLSHIFIGTGCVLVVDHILGCHFKEEAIPKYCFE